jgi:ankyrin repeat protein
VVQLLLNTGKVDIDSRDKYGQTPLWWAAAREHKAVVQLLLATGKVDINWQDEYRQTLLL